MKYWSCRQIGDMWASHLCVCLSVCVSVCHIKELESCLSQAGMEHDEVEQSDTHPPHYTTYRQTGSDGGDRETTNDQDPFELYTVPITCLLLLVCCYLTFEALEFKLPFRL